MRVFKEVAPRDQPGISRIARPGKGVGHYAVRGASHSHGGLGTHPVAIVTTSARNVAASERPIRPALAPDFISQISFILACSCLKPLVHPVLIGVSITA